MRDYIHFCFSERKKIKKFLNKGKSLRWIGKTLCRSVSSISEEIERNKVKGVYSPKKANHKAYVRRREAKIQCMKVALDPELKTFVAQNITDDQSPEGISGRLKNVRTDLQYASAKAIYKFVHSVHGRQIEKHLYSKAVGRNGGPKRNRPVWTDGRIMIDERPKRVDSRIEFGHFEGDFIESGKDGKGSILVLVERKTRYPFLRYVEDRTNQNINCTVEEILSDTHALSLTIDNDISFQKHKELSVMIEAEIYFCHPQSPHEKGTVENRNKAVRRYVKKRIDISSLPKEIFSYTEDKLRNKYMKCLNYRTPKECFIEEMREINMKKSAECGMISVNKLLTKSVRLEGFM